MSPYIEQTREDLMVGSRADLMEVDPKSKLQAVLEKLKIHLDSWNLQDLHAATCEYRMVSCTK